MENCDLSETFFSTHRRFDMFLPAAPVIADEAADDLTPLSAFFGTPFETLAPPNPNNQPIPCMKVVYFWKGGEKTY